MYNLHVDLVLNGFDGESAKKSFIGCKNRDLEKRAEELLPKAKKISNTKSISKLFTALVLYREIENEDPGKQQSLLVNDFRFEQIPKDVSKPFAQSVISSQIRGLTWPKDFILNYLQR